MNAHSPAARFPLGRLLLLMGSAFAANTGEFLPAGVLPQMAAGLGVSEARIGLLVSTFALTVAISALPLTILTSRIGQKRLLVIAIFAVGLANLISALAPTYGLLAGSRVLGGLGHGLFWSTAMPYAASLVRQAQVGRAVSVVNMGTSLGFILGVPLGTAIGLAVHWRAAFGAAGLVLIGFALAVAVLLPAVPRPIAEPARGSLLGDRGLHRMLVPSLIVILAALGQYSLYTYISPWILGPGGVTVGALSTLLFVFGLASAAGLVLVGVVADRGLTMILTIVLGATALAVVAMALLAGIVPTAVLVALWGIAFAGFPTLVQSAALRVATPRAHGLAGAIIAVAFNLAISGGAFVGGQVLELQGLAALPWTQLAFTLAAVLVTLLVLPRVLREADREHARAARSRAESEPAAASESAPERGTADCTG